MTPANRRVSGCTPLTRQVLEHLKNASQLNDLPIDKAFETFTARANSCSNSQKMQLAVLIAYLNIAFKSIDGTPLFRSHDCIYQVSQESITNCLSTIIPTATLSDTGCLMRMCTHVDPSKTQVTALTKRAQSLLSSAIIRTHDERTFFHTQLSKIENLLRNKLAPSDTTDTTTCLRTTLLKLMLACGHDNFTGYDLSMLTLNKIDLHGITLDRVKVDGLTLIGSRLDRDSLVALYTAGHRDFSEVDLSKADLTGIIYPDMQLTKATVEATKLDQSSFLALYSSGRRDFSRVHLTIHDPTSLASCGEPLILANARLDKNTLLALYKAGHRDFSEVEIDLHNIDFTTDELNNTAFALINLEGTIFKNAKFSSSTLLTLYKAGYRNFSKVDLSGVNLNDINIDEAILTGANITNAVLPVDKERKLFLILAIGDEKLFTTLLNEPGATQIRLYGNSLAHLAAGHNFSHSISALSYRVALSGDESRNSYHEMPLHTAIRYGSLAFVTEFVNHQNENLEHVINVIYQGQSLTLDPIGYAIFCNQADVARFLLQNKNSNISRRLSDLIELAVKLNHYYLLTNVLLADKRVKELVHRAEHGHPLAPAFAQAAFLSDVQTLKIIAAQFHYVAENPDPKFPPLHHAVKSSNSAAMIIQTLDCLFMLGVPDNMQNDNRDISAYVSFLLRNSALSDADKDKFTIIEQYLQTRAQKIHTMRYRAINYHPQNIQGLVFSGGGPKGAAYIGVINELSHQMADERLSQVRRIAGTSAGAIVAGLLAAGCTPQQLADLLQQDLMTFIDNAAAKRLLEGVTKHRAIFGVLTDLLARYCADTLTFGVFSGEYVRAIRNLTVEHGLCEGLVILNTIEENIQKCIKAATGGKETGENLTFGELHRLIQLYPHSGLKELHIVVTDISNDNVGIKTFSSEDPDSADYIIAHAIRASMSIPGVFTAYPAYFKRHGRVIQDGTTRYIDGGLIRNRPIDIFDYSRFQHAGLSDDKQDYPIFNERVIGFALNTTTTTSTVSAPGRSNTKDYIARIIGIYAEAESRLLGEKKFNDRRMVAIDCEDINLLSFTLTEEQTEQLIAKGSNDVRAFFGEASSQLPLPELPSVRTPAISPQTITPCERLQLAPQYFTPIPAEQAAPN